MAKSQQSINPTTWVAACCISATIIPLVKYISWKGAKSPFGRGGEGRLIHRAIKGFCTGCKTNCWGGGFSHDVTKIQTKKLSINILSFYLHEVLQHLKTLSLFTQIFKGFFVCNRRRLNFQAFSWRPGRLLCGFFEILLSKYSLSWNKINITSIFMSSSSDEFTLK